MSDSIKTVPDGFVTDQELVARGITADAQARGRSDGALKYAALGTGFAYRNEDVSAWLAAEIDRASKTSRAVDRYAAGRRAAASSGGSAKTQWDTAVNALIAEGKTASAACATVARQNPGLRERMIGETNRR